MLFYMAKRQSVIDFVNDCCVLQKDGMAIMGEFRRACQRYAFTRGDNPPTARLISRVLREEYGIEPVAHDRYEWHYAGVRFGVGALPYLDR